MDQGGRSPVETQQAAPRGYKNKPDLVNLLKCILGK